MTAPIAGFTASVPTELASTAAMAMAVVFAVAATAKVLGDDDGGLAALGLPAPRLIGRVLPPVELLVAAALLAQPRWGAVASIMLLTAFTAVLAVAVGRGRSVSCGCLGSLTRRPVGWSTLARNGGLVALSALALGAPTMARPDLASVLVVGGLIIVGAIGVELIETRRTVGRIWSVELAGESHRRNRS